MKQRSKNDARLEIFDLLKSLELFKTLPPDVENKLLTVFRDIEDPTKYMLSARFKQSKKAKSNTVGADFVPESRRILMETGQMPKKAKLQQPNPLHIVKAFKQLELLILRHRAEYKIDLEGLELGPFLLNFVKAADSITTLLLCIPNFDEDVSQAALSILHSSICIYRQFKCKTESDPSTITDKYTGSLPIEQVLSLYFGDERIDHFIGKFLDTSKMIGHDRLFMYSGNASSPNGGHSSVNYLADIAGLRREPELWNSTRRLAQHFANGKEFTNIIDNIAEIADYDPKYKDDKIHSRLVTFTAPGGKSRVIAVVDWASQTALSAIHKAQFQFLQLLPADKTFDHKKGLELYNSGASSYFSLDLSAATDRLPRLLQAKLIERLFTKLGLNGKGISTDWLAVVDRSYSTKNSGLAGKADTLKYEVGQGMGLFSSWSSMAILHHYIVSELCGVEQNSYALVGDDLLIKSDSRTQFNTYLKIMAEIGVKVNMTKTLVSEDAPHTIEFARNYVILGHKILPIPIGVIFAYIDGDVSAAEVFYNFTPALKYVNISKLLTALSISDKMDLHLIGYYAYKHAIYGYDYVVGLLSQHAVHLELTEQEFSLIVQEAARADKGDSLLSRNQLFFIETLLSQCTMRRPKDLKMGSLMAYDFAALSFEGRELSRYSDFMKERLEHAIPICYEPSLGNPTTTKLERRIIADLIKFKQLKRKRPPKRLPKKFIPKE